MSLFVGPLSSLGKGVQSFSRALPRAKRVFLTLLLLFFTSRILILGISFTAHNHFQIDRPDRSWREHIEMLWSKFDVEWYKSTAVNGYEKEPFSAQEKKNWAFLPLYPMIVKGALTFFQEEDFFIVASLLSNFLTIGALFILVQTFKERIKSSTTFFFLYLVSAGSFYFSIPYNESLSLFLVALTFYYTHQKKYFLAAFLAGLGAITRVQLISLILIPFIPLLTEKQGERRFLKCVNALILFTLPFLFHMVYLNHVSGNLTAFFDMQQAWGNTHPFPLEALVVFIQNGFTNGPCQWLHLLVWSVFILCFIRNYKKIPLNEALFCLAVFLISTSTEKFWGAYRYVLLLTPIYVVLSNEQEWFKRSYIYLNLIIGTIYIIAFVSNYGIVI